MKPEVQQALDLDRYKVAKWILAGCLVIGLMVLALGILAPVQSVLPGAVALGTTAFAALAVKSRNRQYRLFVGQAGVAQAIGLVAALSGTGWQMDAHMLFFVALASMVSMVDLRAIFLGATTIVLHHLSLGVFLPHLVFPTFDLRENLERSVFHAALVALEVIALTLAVRMRLQLTRQVQGALTEARAAMAEAELAGKAAENARNDAEAEARAARVAQDQAEELVEGLRVEQLARARSDANAHAIQEESEATQNALLKDQTEVVSALRGGLERIVAGDLTGQITTSFPQGYEGLRNDYNRALDTLSSVLSEVSDSTNDLLARVAAVGVSAKALAGRTERQIDSLDATSTAVRALNATVLSASKNAHATAQAAGTVKSDAMSGGEVVRRVVGAMSDIEASSQEIAKINAVMDGIAFQTNLLALNAGVEAARAGEAGRGFSVVASEVRALSQRATEAARGINELTERSGRQVRDGVTLVGQAGLALDAIVTSVAGMTASAEQIAHAAEEQSTGLHAVSTSMTELDAVAQSNAAMFEETSAACEVLTERMQHIAQRMQDFRLNPKGGPADWDGELPDMRNAS